MLNTWWNFGNVRNYSRQPLYYYLNDGVTTGAQNAGLAHDLLGGVKPTGGCTAWQYYLLDCFLAHGITSVEGEDVVFNYPTGYPKDDKILVGNWQADDTTSWDPNYPYMIWTAVLNPQSFEMVPCPRLGPNYGYGDLSSVAGLAGQNSGTPAEKVFRFHAIVKYYWADGSHSYLDPSYMQSYADPDDMEAKMVRKIGTPLSTDPPNPNAPLSYIEARDAVAPWGDLQFLPDTP